MNVDKLSAKQRALYELLLKEKKGQLQATAAKALERTIPSRPGTEPAPASFSQQRLWVVDQLEGERAFAYNVHITVQFNGLLDIALLERCVNQVVRRHESLRTVFAAREGDVPIQVVVPEVHLAIPVEDISDLTKEEQDAEVERRTSEESRRLFDLQRGPLLRGKVLRLGTDNHVALITMHHLVTDRWSLGVFVRELMAFYAAEVTGQKADLPELPIQYGDYAVWQRERMQGERLRAEQDFWTKHLGSIPPPLELPTDRPRPPEMTFRGSRQFVTLPVALTRALKDVSQQEGATLFMTLLTAYQTLLHRYSRQTDITVGSPIAGRNLPELEPLIGFFVNTLVLRNDLGGDPTFRELLRRAKEVCMAAYAHQELPFEKLVEELRPPRDLSRHPIFQVMFSFQNTPRQDLAMPGLQSTYLLVDPGSSKVDLLLELREDRPDEIFGWLEYSTDLFDLSTIQRLRAHFYNLLAAAAAQPDTRLSQLPLLDPQERLQLLSSWNDTSRPFDALPLHLSFQAQASLTPDAPALSFGDESLSYRQLHQRVLRVARALQSFQPRPDVPIGLCAHRSTDLIVGLLAILHSGAPYLPLDPHYPAERLAFMLQDSGACLVLSQPGVADALVSDSVRVLSFDEALALGGSHEAPPAHVPPDSLAYIIYTSGSTGRPKGVMVPHRTVANFLSSMDGLKESDAAGTWLAVTSVSFDIHVLEILWTLCRGFHVILHDEQGAARGSTAQALPAVLRRHAVTHLQCTPSFARTLLLAPEVSSALGSLKHLLVGGEALPGPLAKQLRAALPTARLTNVYGPTETTVWSSSHRVEGNEPPSTVSIGKPLANTRLYVLDAHSQPTPTGVPGELFIAGDGVVRGYLRRPELTAERFLPDNLSGVPGSRMYRTGDLARWRHDGTLDFLGRTDFQVKVRGFRIELGEVEAALSRHPDVRQAVAGVHRDVSGDGLLVAWFVPASPRPAGEGVQSLRDWARQHLPEHMVPSLFLSMEALPLTPNGKVDRKALPPPDSRHFSARDFVAPRNPAEELLAQIFSQLLNLPRVGIHDSFFELGGHSLLGTQAVSRLRAAFGVELPLRELFQAPSIAALAPRIEALRAQQHGGLIAPPRPAPRSGPPALSFAQQRLWFLDQLEPGNAGYNIPAAVRLDGALDLTLLQQAFTELARRHESLRTTFDQGPHGPVQNIHAPAPVALSLVDLTSLATDEREPEAHRRIAAEVRQGFDLVRGPLLRVTLLRLSERQHILLLVMHHIVSDGWSLGILVREFAALYRAFAASQRSPLPEVPLQYADYAVWQHDWLKGEVLESQREWWRKHLEGAPQSLELPTDRPRPAEQTYRGARVWFSLPVPLTRALKDLGRREGATLFMTLMSGYQALLLRYSGQTDLVVGSPIAGRRFAELEGLIGCFVNTLALRAEAGVDASFRGLMTRTRGATLEAHAHQDIPFEKLVEELRPTRDLSRHPIFQAMFSFQNIPWQDLDLPGVRSSDLRLDPGSAKVDLHLDLQENHPDEIIGWLEYSTDLFDASTVQRMSGHFQNLLAAAAAQPDTRLSQLPLLDPQERLQLLSSWNDTSRPFDALPLHLAFQAQASLTPDAPALSFGDESLSYRQLHQRVLRVARALQSFQPRPDVPIGLCAHRSTDLIVGLLAILHSGAPYLPLDPHYPAERLAFMLQDSGACLVLSQPGVADALVSDSVRVLSFDEALALGGSHEAPPAHVPPDSLAYIIYTSGSTGRPKGVMVPHRTVANFLSSMDGLKESDAAGTWLAVTSVSFDIHVLEILWTLCRGFHVILHDEQGTTRDSAVLTLPQVVRRHVITHLGCTPSFARTLLLAPEVSSSLGSLKHLLVGGEALPGPLAKQLRAALPTARLTNVYGPTETTVYSSSHPVSGEEFPSTISIGKPLANTRLYILDAHGEPTPTGVPGELFIAGDGVVRGYLRRPELTAERFVPDALSGVPGTRMYRTGDLARWRNDGTLDFLGRTDFQVKVRGFRIELGEVEAALSRHPDVRQAVAGVHRDANGDGLLVAWYVPTTSPLPEGEGVQSLRDWARKHLPEHMVPSLFLSLEALPLTPNGKVDRKALPTPDAVLLTAQRDFVAPRNPAEELLAQIFSQLLNVPRVGIHDSFFELGGHSLLGTQAVSRLRAAFGVELPLRELFQAPSIAALAPRIEALRAQQHGTLLAPPKPAPRSGPPALSFAQQRLWFLDQLEPGNAGYNLPAAVRLDGALDLTLLQQAFTELARRHESLRTTFDQGPHGPVQNIHDATSAPVAFTDLSHLAPEAREAEARRLSAAELRQGFDLAQGPLLRVTLLRLSEQQHVLLLVMHHIVTDGWSLGVLVRELADLYRALASGSPSPLPTLPVQYADYAVWQREWLRDEVLDTQRAWWRKHLEGAPHSLDLPTDLPRPSLQTFRGDSVPVRLMPQVSQELRAFCHQEGVTPFMALLGAFQAFLGRYTSQDDIVVGTPIAGRRFSELEGLIGLFINTLALRARFDGRPSFRELMARTRETTLEAYAHQDIPFEKLVEDLRPARDLSRSPIFQAFFALQNAPLPSVSDATLSVQPFEIDNPTAKFDLELNLSDAPEGFSGFLIFNADLFLPSTAQRLASLFSHFLQALLAEPAAPIHALSLLSPDDLRTVLLDWNRSPSDFPRDSSLPQRFASIVSRFPDSIALEFGDSRLTYSQLDAASNQLAHLLISRGVLPDAPVALCLDRSLELIISLLAILKAGGAYLPLDSSYPRQRLAFMLEDAQPVLLLSSSSLLPSLPVSDSLPVLLIEDLQSELSRFSSQPPSLQLQPELLAYIDFTSGSTGRPKGVAVSHRSVLRTVCNTPYADLSPSHSFLLIAPISFDASTLEVWGPLLNGGRLVVFPPSSPSDLDLLSSVLSSHSVSTLHLTSGLFSQLVDSHLDALKPVRQLLTGGDVVSAPHVRRVLDALRIPVTACYGPTEGTLFTSTFRMTSADQVPSSIPIGTPITATQVFILDSHGQPVAPGTPGELFLSGEGLARGYVRSPSLTAERFLPNPFSSSPGARMYRTGDRARWRHDGVLEFLGRADFQVKIRGFRIELAEVEAALLSFDGVREALAMAREDVPGDKRLVGYLVADASLDLQALRAHLQRRLPEYMLPSALLRMDAFPLTANAKVDRKALPAPEARSELRPFVAPRDELEQQVADLWAEVLRVDRVGIHDDFFELGGHSLLATQLIARVRSAFEVDLRLRELFEQPTVEGMTLLIVESLAQQVDDSELEQLVDALDDTSRGES